MIGAWTALAVFLAAVAVVLGAFALLYRHKD